MKRKLLLGTILTFVFLIMAMGVWKILPRQKGEIKTGKISVVSSFYPLYFLATEIGGDRVDVKNITPVGSEPHDYEPTAQDMADIQNSKLLLLNGNKFEAWGEKIKDELMGSGVAVVDVGDGLFVGNDPHVWLSPELIKKEAHVITTSLVQIDPKGQADYANNLTILEMKLNDLQQRYLIGLRSCNKKEIVTAHEAFGYMAREFGFTQIAITGLSPDEEPSTKQLGEIAKMAKEKNIKFIFFENLVSPKLADTLAGEIGARTLLLDPIEGIKEEFLAQGRNYITVMDENLTNIKIALECQ